MTQEFIAQLFSRHTKDEPYMSEEQTVAFSKDILFEAAKLTCINCKLNGPSEKTRSGMRVHVITSGNNSNYKVTENCRAQAFYIED